MWLSRVLRAECVAWGVGERMLRGKRGREDERRGGEAWKEAKGFSGKM
jgi:hypothetical protein